MPTSIVMLKKGGEQFKCFMEIFLVVFTCGQTTKTQTIEQGEKYLTKSLAELHVEHGILPHKNNTCLVCRIIITVWDTFTCPDGKVGEY